MIGLIIVLKMGEGAGRFVCEVIIQLWSVDGEWLDWCVMGKDALQVIGRKDT